ncbi:MAG: DNA-binding protein [Deltaproteobacteria bacterium]|nr:DNA-binding protein [Deltaproteobacteria bacterium]
MNMINPNEKNIFMGQIGHDKDLLEELTSICKDNNITLGKIEAIGAVQKGEVGYYDQKEKIYLTNSFNAPMEILTCNGNISLLNETPMVHAHITFANRDGSTCGGHLLTGTKVFACEYIIYQFTNATSLNRTKEKITGLNLWK